MKMKSNFQIVNIVDEYMAIPVGDEMTSFGGTVLLNEVSAFLLEHMKKDITKDELIDQLLTEYDVDPERAKKDVEDTISKLLKVGLIQE